MIPCIKIKDKQHRHQIVYTGNGDEVRCINHCGLQSFKTKQEQEEFFEADQQQQQTRWPNAGEPNGAEL